MELVEKHNTPDSPRMALCLELLLTKEVNKQREREEMADKQARGTSVLEVSQPQSCPPPPTLRWKHHPSA